MPASLKSSMELFLPSRASQEMEKHLAGSGNNLRTGGRRNSNGDRSGAFPHATLNFARGNALW